VRPRGPGNEDASNHEQTQTKTSESHRVLGRQRDDDGQNKFLQINGSKDSS
jgi:hypothetical protein